MKLAAETTIPTYGQSGIDERMKVAALEFGPDVIHAHDLETLKLGCELKAELNIPLVYDSHEIASERNHHSPAPEIRAGIKEAKFIPDADVVIMVSDGCAEFTSAKSGIALPTVIMNTLDFDPTQTSGYDLRNELNIPTENLVIVHQGGLQKNRGV